ncbi:MAG: glycosyltransferase family 9 protein [Deltaproteobacteria bacterium]|nr:glycosyltransferase family 9 protein [Deltaproteobacteria bacterium]
MGRNYLYQKPYLAVLQALIDAPGYLVFGSGKKFPAEVKKILVSRIDHLGDVFIASSILPHLKRAYPNASIHFMAGEWAWGYLRSNTFLDRVLIYNSFRLNRSGGLIKNAAKAFSGFVRNIWEMRKERYDLTIDLRAYPFNSIPLMFLGGGGYRVGFATGGFGFLLNRRVPYRSGVHEIEHLADILGSVGVNVSWTDLKPEFNLSKTSDKECTRILDGLGVAAGEPFVLIHTGSGNPSKLWKKEEWQKLVSSITRGCGVKVVAYDTVYNDLRDCIRLPSLISLDLFAAAAKKASVFIGLDSLPAHLAASFSTPTVVVWCGINDSNQWRPIGEHVSVVKRAVDCSPCFRKNGCPSMDCMDISAGDVAQDAVRFLDIQRPPNVVPFDPSTRVRGKREPKRRGQWKSKIRRDL